ncbi:hypothetical protein [Herbiconiux sp. YIM B11900]|uniref:hypothetical protein n=1 Tax=Herbiconiux sp. YIM B11900 TaxID=3404131 RepID=UPI003F844DB9
MPQGEYTADPSPSGLSRRTVLAGAAWSVPVVALAAAAPGAAASGGGGLTVAFDATLIQLDYQQTFLALVVIQNTSGADIVDEQAEFVFTGLDTESPYDFVTSYPTEIDSSLEGWNDALQPQNDLFRSAGSANGSFTVVSNGGISIPAGGTLVFGLYFSRPVESSEFRFWTVAGIFHIGPFDGVVGQTQVELTPPV